MGGVLACDFLPASSSRGHLGRYGKRSQPVRLLDGQGHRSRLLRPAVASLSMGGWVAMVLYFGAAMRDATPEQRQRLKELLPDRIEEIHTTDLKDKEAMKVALHRLFVVIHSVMPDDWVPTGEA